MITSNEKLRPDAAQRLMLTLTTAAMRQLDIAASSQASPRDRKRALARVQRALAALSDKPK